MPSLIYQTAKITGYAGYASLSGDLCSEDDLDALTLTFQTTLKGVACGQLGDCDVALTYFCGNNARRGLSSRDWHYSGSWQITYGVTVAFSCDVGSCDSLEDIATLGSISSMIRKTIADYFNSGEFVVSLGTSLASAGLTLPDCFTIWSITEDPVPETAVAASYYPDWIDLTRTCLSDGYEPFYMTTSQYWLSDSLEQCCEQFYSGWTKNLCLHPEGSGGSGLWYVSETLGKCVIDCEGDVGVNCGGRVNLAQENLFTDPRNCCETKLPWVFTDFCVAYSLSCNHYGGTDRWYSGDISGSKVCVRDCDPVDGVTASCGGLVEDSFVVLHDSVEDCCSAEHDWMTSELCVARSGNTDTDKYWPDETEGRCFKDAENPAQDLGIPLFNSAIECCQTKIWWISEAMCVSASNNTSAEGSGNFFLDWHNEQCGKDCEGPAPCAGLAPQWEDLYDTESSCCDRIPWVDREDCVYTGIPKISQGTGASVTETIGSLYYPDWKHHSGTCLNDGNEPLYMKLVTLWLSVSLEECCDQHYGGWNKDRCISTAPSII